MKRDLRPRPGSRRTAQLAAMAPPPLEPGDALVGGKTISVYVSELLGEDVPPKKCYQWIGSGRIPAGKFGPRALIGSKRAIRDALARAAAGLATP